MLKKYLKFPETFILFSYSPSILGHTASLLGKSQKRKKKKTHNKILEGYKISLHSMPGQINLNEFPHTIFLMMADL